MGQLQEWRDFLSLFGGSKNEDKSSCNVETLTMERFLTKAMWDYNRDELGFDRAWETVNGYSFFGQSKGKEKEIKTTYDISLDSQISLLSLGFSLHIGSNHKSFEINIFSGISLRHGDSAVTGTMRLG